MRQSYYQSELERVSGDNPEYPRSIQIRDNGKDTKWLSLNDESATELVNYLEKHYKIEK
jgi:hypothetical protein